MVQSPLNINLEKRTIGSLVIKILYLKMLEKRLDLNGSVRKETMELLAKLHK